jgi:hypothetical protein
MLPLFLRLSDDLNKSLGSRKVNYRLSAWSGQQVLTFYKLFTENINSSTSTQADTIVL